MPETSEEDFLKCYEANADAIYRHCFFRVFSKQLAEEMMQEAFMRTWDYLLSGKKVDNLRAFVYRVANNLVIDHSRRKKEERLETVLDNSPSLEPAVNSVAELERNLLVKEMLRVIAELPEDDRRVITLRHVDELNPREIAEILGITSNHASVKLNRAMKTLRAQVKKFENQ